jgi:hypothetical protein
MLVEYSVSLFVRSILKLCMQGNCTSWLLVVLLPRIFIVARMLEDSRLMLQYLFENLWFMTCNMVPFCISMIWSSWPIGNFCEMIVVWCYILFQYICEYYSVACITVNLCSHNFFYIVHCFH